MIMDKKTQLSISIPGLMEDWNAYKKGLKEIMRIATRFQKRNAVSGQNRFNPHRKCLQNKIDKRKIKFVKTRIEGEDQCIYTYTT